MEEKVLVKSYCPDTKKFLKIMAIIGLVLALIFFMVRCSNAKNKLAGYQDTYRQHLQDGNCGYGYSSNELCWTCEYVEENFPFGEGFGAGLRVFIAVMALAFIVKLLLSSFSLVVTDKRVYCKTLWIHQVCLPVDSITAVARVGFFNMLAIGAPAGRIYVSFVLNSKTIYNTLNDLFIARQEKSLATVMGIVEDVHAIRGKETLAPASATATPSKTATDTARPPIVTAAPVAGGWTCTCGRNHAPYESSCVCGATKVEAKIKT